MRTHPAAAAGVHAAALRKKGGGGEGERKGFTVTLCEIDRVHHPLTSLLRGV